jgi:hypothetical protein
VRYQLVVGDRGRDVACVAVVEAGHAGIEALYD